MAIRVADTPAGLLYRIARYPDPLAWTPLDVVGSNRFDDPRGEFRVLYAAEQRLACFVETLAPYRPDLELLARLQEMAAYSRADEAVEPGLIPEDWRRVRRIGSLRLVPGQRWLDLRSVETREALRREMAPLFRGLGRDDFDLGDALDRDRRLTQAIARWTHDRGYQGIAYSSRFDARLDCWAIFEGAALEPVEIAVIAADDEDLGAALRLLNLRTSER